MPQEDLELALHTAEPEVGDDQFEHEADYEGYARVPATDGHHFFPECKSGVQRLTHYSLGKSGKITEVGELTPHTVTTVGAGPVIVTE